MAFISQLFTPEELARDLQLHGLTPGELEMLRRALADELGKIDPGVRDTMRERVRQMYALLRPGSTPQASRTP
jgi:hypothetical protein